MCAVSVVVSAPASRIASAAVDDSEREVSYHAVAMTITKSVKY